VRQVSNEPYVLPANNVRSSGFIQGSPVEFEAHLVKAFSDRIDTDRIDPILELRIARTEIGKPGS